MLGPTLEPPRTDSLSREGLHAYFEEGWRLNAALFGTLTEESAYYSQPDPLRNPLIFYYGHTAAFFVNKLCLAGLLNRGVDERLDLLLARGVDPERAEDLEKGCWPSVDEVTAYRDAAHALVRDTLSELDCTRPVGPSDPHWALLMALEHERIHFETSSVLLRQAPVQALKRPEAWRYAPTATPPPAQSVAVEAGTVRLGKPSEHPTFGWDNEYGQDELEVGPFEVGAHLVCNEAFLAFVGDRGYARDELWSQRGLAWRTRHEVKHPRFWVPTDAGFRYRALFDELDLPLDWPVEVNAFEAEAFCAWKGEGWRLPTEGEHLRLTDGVPLVNGDVHGGPYSLDLRAGSPTGIAAGPAHRGVYDVFGNVWQWLADDFRPLPGFRPHRLYPEFSEPYFDRDHASLIGGSWASTGTSSSRFYRLWFRRHFYQHAGFRLARSLG